MRAAVAAAATADISVHRCNGSACICLINIVRWHTNERVRAQAQKLLLLLLIRPAFSPTDSHTRTHTYDLLALLHCLDARKNGLSETS